MENRGYSVCVICYFIKQNPTDQVPPNYENMCKALNAKQTASGEVVQQQEKAAAGGSRNSFAFSNQAAAIQAPQ